MEVTPFTTIPSDPVVKVLSPVSALYSAGLEVLVPEEEMFSPGDTTMISIELDIKTATQPVGLLISLNQ